MLTLDCQPITKSIRDRIRNRPAPRKFLAGILVGDNPASDSFQKIKSQAAKDLGIDYRSYRLAPELGNDGLRREISRIASQKSCGGLVLQLPLPEKLNGAFVVNAIPREKDADVLGERALGAFYNGRNPVSPPAVGVVEEVIRATHLVLRLARVAVVGPGFLVGRPVANWLMGHAREVIVLDKGFDPEILKNTDLVITATGVPGLIKKDWLSAKTSVIDFGYSQDALGKLSGDLDLAGLSDAKKFSPGINESFFTPTPGGTGPILVAKLLENFVVLNSK